MALYQDGILISGANTLPKMTLAEYNALPAELKPEYWVCLDKDYDDILAEKTDIAPVEATSTASQAHVKGSQFYFNNQLVTATADISVGGTIVLNGNCEVSDSVTEQIKKSNVDYELSVYNATPWSDSDNSISRIGGRVFVTFSLQLNAPLQQGESLIIGAFNTDCYPKNRYVRFLYSNENGIVNQGYVDKNTGRINITNIQNTSVTYVCGSFSYLADN